jgi:hypothetical protein
MMLPGRLSGSTPLWDVLAQEAAMIMAVKSNPTY